MLTHRMKLFAFLKTGPTSHHQGAWRHPDTAANDFLDPRRYEHIGRVLEAGFFDGLFFADVLGIFDHYKGGFDTYLGKGGQTSLLDPLLVLPVIARATSHIGLGVTLSTTFCNPYHIARWMASIDHISNGRAAWNVVASTSNLEAQNFGVREILARESRYDRGDEVMEACNALWSSWDEGAVICEKSSGTFVDTSKVRYSNYAGKWISTRGPLNVPRSPQGKPVIMQAGASARGRDFAARWAEVIFALQHSRDEMKEFYQDVKGRMAKVGRDPDECAILPSVDIMIGETDQIARERLDYVNDLVDPELGLALVSSHIGADLSGYSLDQPLTDIELEEGSRGSFDIILKRTKAEGLSLGEVAKRFGASELTPQIAGTPETIVDQLQDMFESGCCDGFIITPTIYPGTFEQFVRGVVPELQKRKLFRTAYEGRTLRENLRAP